jgi:hypothetical protein
VCRVKTTFFKVLTGLELIKESGETTQEGTRREKNETIGTGTGIGKQHWNWNWKKFNREKVKFIPNFTSIGIKKLTAG